ncbi:hypothetical protein [Halorussus caseinilyticus]|uniref:FkbM family methyltransferase n=1 Tax=Halorussus caseinilyticus TaxID=3034025 RepID=A0ABD5WRW8_9EURY
MGFERFVASDEAEYSFEVGGESVTYHISSLDELRIIGYMHSTEAPVLEDIVSHVSADDSFLDVGANVGIYAAVAGTVGASAVAVEPIQQNVVKARKNLELNCDDWETLPFAMGDGERVTQMDADTLDGIDDMASLGEGRSRCRCSTATR